MRFFKKGYAKKKYVSKKKKFVRGGRKSSGVSSAVKTYVNRTIHKNIENKQVELQVISSFGNVVHDAALNMTPLTPYPGGITIQQGLGQGNRTGNEVKVRKMILRYVLFPNGYNVTTNSVPRPTEVQLFLGYVKNASGITPLGTDVDNLFQYNNTDNAPSGTLMDLNQVINKDYWVIKKAWRHKLGNSGNTGTGSAINNQYYANNDFKYNVVKRMDITKYCPKTFKFNDATSAALQGTGLFFFYQAVSADGTLFAGSQLPVTIQYQWSIEYEDA